MEPKRIVRHGKTYLVHPDPTPDEIKAMCAEIRKEWTPDQEVSRNCYKNRTPYPISVTVSDSY